MQRTDQRVDDIEPRSVGRDKSSGLVAESQLAQRRQGGSRALSGKGVGRAVTFNGMPSSAPLLGELHEDTDCTEPRIPVMIDPQQNAGLARRVRIRLRRS